MFTGARDGPVAPSRKADSFKSRPDSFTRRLGSSIITRRSRERGCLDNLIDYWMMRECEPLISHDGQKDNSMPCVGGMAEMDRNGMTTQHRFSVTAATSLSGTTTCRR